MVDVHASSATTNAMMAILSPNKNKYFKNSNPHPMSVKQELYRLKGIHAPILSDFNGLVSYLKSLGLEFREDSVRRELKDVLADKTLEHKAVPSWITLPNQK